MSASTTDGEASKAPQIVTFYSYKGGTGRSMALANIAFLLAGNGYRVLVIDWDLEAPGLHRYFHPFLKDKELDTSEGIIDFVVDYATKAVSTPEPAEDWYVPYGNILRYASSLDFRLPSWGVIDFVPAGRQGPDYAAKVNSFNWQHFYEELDGGIFLEFSKKSMTGYDFVLIDSRTGVSDTSGICTVQMPEKLVVCFTPNSQSIEGAAAVAESAYHQRIKPDGSPGLSILPVLTRVERGEQERIQMAKDLARMRFDDLLGCMRPEVRDEYWSRIAIPHEPYYAFEEVLAVFAEKPERTSSMLAAMKLVGEYVAGTDLKFPEIDEAVRERVLDRFTRRMKRKVIRTLSLKEGGVTDVGLSADGSRAISAHSEGTVVIWDLEPGRARHTIQVQRTRKIGVAISADGQQAAVGARGFTVWNAETGAELAKLGGPEDITAISLSPDGSRAMCCSSDSTVVLWDVTRRERLHVLRGHTDWVRAVALSENGLRAVSGGDDKTVILWDVQTGQVLRQLRAHRDWVRSVAISDSGQLAVSGSDDGAVIVWDLEKGQPRHTWMRHAAPITAVSLNRDGKRAISGAADGRIFFWDVESGQPLRLLEGHVGAVAALTLSTGGRRAISGGADGNVMLWDIEAGDAVEPIVKPTAVPKESYAPPEPPPRPKARLPLDRSSRDGPVTPLYWFFVSYAHIEPDELLSRLIRDLTAELRNRVGGEVATFFDKSSFDTGQEFHSHLHNSLQASRTLLALYSPNYFASDYCGREFAAFFQHRPGFIFPVVWTPPGEIPSPANQIQYLSSGMPQVYGREGLRYIMKLRKHRDAYFEIVDQLARDLHRLGEAAPATLNPLPFLDQLENAFHSSEGARLSRAVGFVFLAPTSQESLEAGSPSAAYGSHAGDWLPFDRDSVARISQRAAAELGLRYEELPLDSRFPDVVRQWSTDQAPIVVVIDSNAVRIKRLWLLFELLRGIPSASIAFVANGSVPDLPVQPASDDDALMAAISRSVTQIRLGIIARAGADSSAGGSLPNLSRERNR